MQMGDEGQRPTVHEIRSAQIKSMLEIRDKGVELEKSGSETLFRVSMTVDSVIKNALGKVADVLANVTTKRFAAEVQAGVKSGANSVPFDL